MLIFMFVKKEFTKIYSIIKKGEIFVDKMKKTEILVSLSGDSG